MAEGDVVSNEEGAAQAAPSAPTGSGLDLIGLTKVFTGGTVAVDDVNLHVDHGEYVVLLGPSGCGKTTTLRMIGGHEFPTGGEILLDGQSRIAPCSTTSPSASRWRRCRRRIVANAPWRRSTWSVSRSSRNGSPGRCQA